MFSSFIPINSKSKFPTPYKSTMGGEGGGSINFNLSKGITKHKGTTKQQGVERYLGGQENNEVQRSHNTPCNNEVVRVAKHEQQ
jgi:hypothetical protein